MGFLSPSGLLQPQKAPWDIGNQYSHGVFYSLQRYCAVIFLLVSNPSSLCYSFRQGILYAIGELNEFRRNELRPPSHNHIPEPPSSPTPKWRRQDRCFESPYNPLQIDLNNRSYRFLISTNLSTDSLPPPHPAQKKSVPAELPDPKNATHV